MFLVDKEKFIDTYTYKSYGKDSAKKHPDWFCIKPNATISGLVGDLLTDGHMGSGMVIFSSKNKKELRDFGNLMNLTFNVNYKIRRVTTSYSAYNLYVFSSALVRFLKICGVPEGEKVLQAYDVAMWIKNGNKEIQSNFLQHLFSCDGTVTLAKNIRLKVKFKQNKREELLDNGKMFLNSIRQMLDGFQIKSTRVYITNGTNRKDGIVTKTLEFEIYGTRKNHQSVVNFYKHVGFNNKLKHKKLKDGIELLQSFKAPDMPP